MSQISINKQNLEHLLQNTSQILDHHDKMTIAKGEHFNLFSVLDIETRENKTHSAFLAELLNPKGSHLQGSIFLQLFLQLISKDLVVKQEEDIEEAQSKIQNDLLDKFVRLGRSRVTTEFHIGKINIEDKEGGRIDILIKNRKNILSIENKIHAPDQPAQVQRYYNHEKGNNIIIYLTLEGKKPHKDSRGQLRCGKDYFVLSYREHILDWLKLCLKEVPNLTIVREAINQYILLIKKLTNTLNMKQEKDLDNIMAKYIEEAAYISSNYERMITDLKENFRSEVKEALKKQLKAHYSVTEGKPVKQKYSQLWIKFKNLPHLGFKFGIESFSGNGHGFLFVGIRDMDKSKVLASIPEEKKISAGWRHTRKILTEDGNTINLNHKYTLKILTDPESVKYQKLVSSVVKMTLEFINDYEKILPADLVEGTKEFVESDF